ncbi:hypothetical protein D6D22_07456 [Aureobasidium pullulans]|uniref:Mei2-like C-terminal RNA recognition motif domain-containing protein n=1 Tax=Aureobasidium pullulans TaxID=5580 RepID=A0A4S8XB93_AURPU|nr:hypothetical protein D6D22_07456 [Aureobasidium pullulans]
MARLPQQAWSLFIKIYHQLLPSVQHSSVHQQVIFVILIIKIHIRATARKRKEDKIFWPDRDLFPSQLAKSPLRAPNNEQKRKRSMIYLRIDFSTELNVGYAFVNFTHPEHITNFVNAKVGKPWSLYGSTKRCEVSYATIQGIDCLLAKFLNSVIMEEAASCRPKLWYHHELDVLPDNRHRGGCFVPPQALVPP